MKLRRRYSLRMFSTELHLFTISLPRFSKRIPNFSCSTPFLSSNNDNIIFYLKCCKNISFAFSNINPLNAELNPICYLLALLAHHFLHVSRIRVKSLTLRLLKSCIYGAPILDVSRSHTTTHHSR